MTKTFKSEDCSSMCLSMNNNVKRKNQILFPIRRRSEHVSGSLFDDYGFDDHDFRSSTNLQLINRADKWLHQFEDTIYSYEDNIFPPSAMTTTSKTIAILDSGINPKNDNIIEHMHRIEYRDFVSEDHGDPQDHVGHGTHSTAVLLGIAKKADIRVARITMNRFSIDPNIVAKAISYATDVWKADIICIPFGFPNRTQRIECVQEAILHAYHERVLIFSAAANCGGLDDVAYPANQPEVISVFSTDGEGNQSHFNPFNHSLENGDRVSVLGEAVPSVWTRIGNVSRKSGTSFATPIASGIAAVLMEYLEQRKQFFTEEQLYTASKIKSQKGMLTVMRKYMCVNGDKSYFLRPWKLFNRDFYMVDSRILDILKDV